MPRHGSLKSKSHRRGRVEPYRVFFPAAMVHAAVVLPLAVAAMTIGTPQPLASGVAHGTEMLTGFVLAVVAGFLLPLLSPWRLGALFALWLAGRVLAVVGPQSVWAVAPSALFAGVMVAIIVPRFGRAAKKLRNRATGPIVALIATTVICAGILLHAHAAGLRQVVFMAVVLLSALLLFMGGRILSAAAAGVRQRRGERVKIRVQPRLEGALLLCVLPAVLGLSWPPLFVLTAISVAVMAGVSLVRLYRWRLWRCANHADVWSLGLGYAWVIVGLLLLAAHWLSAWPSVLIGLHCITVGGLGTLTLNVMTRTWLQRRKINPARVYGVFVATVLISAAAALRVDAIAAAAFTVNFVAAACWSLGFVTALITLYIALAKKRRAG